MCAPVAHPCRMSPVDLRWELKPWLKSLKLKSFSWGKSWKGLVLVGRLHPEGVPPEQGRQSSLPHPAPSARG